MSKNQKQKTKTKKIFRFTNISNFFNFCDYVYNLNIKRINFKKFKKKVNENEKVKKSSKKITKTKIKTKTKNKKKYFNKQKVARNVFAIMYWFKNCKFERFNFLCKFENLQENKIILYDKTLNIFNFLFFLFLIQFLLNKISISRNHNTIEKEEHRRKLTKRQKSRHCNLCNWWKFQRQTKTRTKKWYRFKDRKKKMKNLLI